MAESLKKATVGQRPAPARRRKQLIERFLMCLWVKRSSEEVLPLSPSPWKGEWMLKPGACVPGEAIPTLDHDGA